MGKLFFVKLDNYEILDILNGFQWLVCYLLKCTYDKYQARIQQGADVFWAKNDVQIFYAKNLTTVYIQVNTI